MADESILSFSEDISTAEAPEPLPVGDYPATIQAAEVRTSQNSGNKYLMLQLHVSPEDFPPDYPTENNPDGTTLIWRRTLVEDTPRARHNLRRLCEACGVAASKEINVNDFVGTDVRVSVQHDEYQGVKREDITAINSSN